MYAAVVMPTVFMMTDIPTAFHATLTVKQMELFTLNE